MKTWLIAFIIIFSIISLYLSLYAPVVKFLSPKIFMTAYEYCIKSKHMNSAYCLEYANEKVNQL